MGSDSFGGSSFVGEGVGLLAGSNLTEDGTFRSKPGVVYFVLKIKVFDRVFGVGLSLGTGSALELAAVLDCWPSIDPLFTSKNGK